MEMMMPRKRAISGMILLSDVFCITTMLRPVKSGLAAALGFANGGFQFLNLPAV
jgi:hypothetical protein